MSTVNYILATAGHVDHGKSALVTALTGIDPDRLPEEKARGITIELGFVHFDLASPASAQPATTYRVGVVDVPGHEDFVKNMVAGVGSIDIALLVVAADDGWMPQTEEHLQILSYVGVSRGVVALTKVDLVASDESARDQIRLKLAGTPLADAPIVSTSVVKNIGLSELKSALAAELSRTPLQPDIGKPRLAVDRAFTLRGTGTVITGTLTGGSLRKGEAVVLQPGARPARIRTLQSYNREVDQAMPGSRVAINLPDLHPNSTSHAGAAVGRGDVVTLTHLGRASDTFDASVEMSPRTPDARPVREGTRLRVHHGSGSFAATIYFLGGPTLSPGQTRLAQLRFETPFFVFAGDRFILRDWSEQHTLAGGIVLDPDASRRGFRTEPREQFLRARAAHPDEPKTLVATELARDGVVSRPALLPKSRLSRARIDQAVQELVTQKTLILRGDVLADSTTWQRLCGQATDAVDQAHKSHPEQLGLRLADLRQQLSKQIAEPSAFDALVADLCQNGCSKAGIYIRRTNHRPALPPHLQPSGAKLRKVLSVKPLEPPSRKELTPDSLSQQALRFLLQSGEAIEIGEELVLHADPYNAAVETIRGYIRTHGGASVSELRQALNTSRRVMVPLLEKLDRDGVTLRQGDKRILKNS